MGLLAWLFGRRRSADAAPQVRRVGGPAAAPATYAELRALDDAAVAEFTQANADAIVARNAGDTARAAALLEKYRSAYARHVELDAAARFAWNREHGVR